MLWVGFYIQFKIPSKRFTFNKRIASIWKKFEGHMIGGFPVGMTKDFEHFLVILSCITPLDSA